MQWPNLASSLSVLALATLGLVVAPGCEPPDSPMEPATDAPTAESVTSPTGETGVTREYNDDATENDQEDGVTNESIHIDRDPDMEPTEPLE